MKIAITGANGQLGKALQQSLQAYTLIPLTRPDYDISQPVFVRKVAALKPNVIINCAAMTQVDACALDPQRALLVNGFGTQNVALACLHSGAAMVYISTNEVFDGTASEPYYEYAAPNPINPYAESKLAGEKIASQLLQKLYIVRVSWVYSNGGNNFPFKMIKAADKFGKLRVVTDEVSSPTYAPDLAEAIKQLIATEHYGVYHFSNQGVCSRYEYAREILKQSGREEIEIVPITSAEFQRASTPPKYAPLQNNFGAALGIVLRPWQQALQAYFANENIG